MKNKSKIFIYILLISMILFLKNMSNLFKSDYCLEDGDCNAGRIIIINNKEILIDKNSCIENNWNWHDEGNYCKIENVKFYPKEIIYE